MDAACLVCGVPVDNHRLGRQRLTCSRACRSRRGYALYKARWQAAARDRGALLVGDVAACDLCGSMFTAAASHQRFCSALCRSRWSERSKRLTDDTRCAVWFAPCPDCGTMMTHRNQGSVGKKPCPPCRRSRTRAINARKNHARRAAGPLTVTVEDLAKRDGARCNLCRRPVDLTRPGSDPLGPSIDHLLPVSLGGTNDSSNLSLTHLRCNVRRRNREPAQMLMEVG